MNELQTDRWDRFLRRLFAIRAGTVSGTLAPEIVPVIAVEPESRPENEYLRDNHLFWAAITTPTVGATYARVMLLNRSTDRLIIIEEVRSNKLCALELGASYSGSVSGVPQSRDDRYLGPAGQNISAAEIAWSAPITSLIERQYIYPDELQRVSVVIQPGGTFSVQSIEQLVALRVNVSWRERLFENSERR
jgi:hypothetical protein